MGAPLTQRAGLLTQLSTGGCGVHPSVGMARAVCELAVKKSGCLAAFPVRGGECVSVAEPTRGGRPGLLPPTDNGCGWCRAVLRSLRVISGSISED